MTSLKEASRTRHPAETQVAQREYEANWTQYASDSCTLDDEVDGQQVNLASPSPTQVGIGCTQRRALVILVLSTISLGIELSLFGPLFPEFAESKDVSLTISGLVRGIYYLSSFAFLPFLCVQHLRISSKHYLLVGSVLLSFSAAIFGAIENLNAGITFTVLVFGSRITEGIGAGALRASTYMLVADQFPSAIWRTFTILDVSLALGLTIGPIIGEYLYEVGGFGLPFYSAAGLIILIGIVNALLLPEPGLFEARSLTNVWNLMKKPQNFIYFTVIFGCYYYTGFLEVTLEPHLKIFGLRSLFVGMLFAIPEAVYCLLVAAWGYFIRRGLSPVMMIFLTIAFVSLPSALLIGPVNFIRLDTSIHIIAIALVLKGIAQSQKNVFCLYGSYMDAVAKGLTNDISTHTIVYMTYMLAASAGGLFGSSTAGVLYDKIDFKYSTLVVFGLEIILVPGVLTYGFLRRYRRPINFHSSGENRPLLYSDK